MRRSKKKASTKKIRKVVEETPTPQANMPLAGTAMQPVPLTPVEEAKLQVEEAWRDRTKKHLLPARKQRLYHLQREQLPGIYHEKTPMLPGYLNPDKDLPPQTEPPRSYPLGPSAPPAEPESPIWQQQPQVPRNEPQTNLFLERTLQHIEFATQWEYAQISRTCPPLPPTPDQQAPVIRRRSTARTTLYP